MFVISKKLETTFGDAKFNLVKKRLALRLEKSFRSNQNVSSKVCIPEFVERYSQGLYDAGFCSDVLLFSSLEVLVYCVVLNAGSSQRQKALQILYNKSVDVKVRADMAMKVLVDA